MKIFMRAPGDGETMQTAWDDTAFVGLELNDDSGDKWIAGSFGANDDVQGHVDLTLSLVNIPQIEEDVEGHNFYPVPGQETSRFDIQLRDIEQKTALRRALDEDRVAAIQLQDADNRIISLRPVKRALAAAADAMAFVWEQSATVQQDIQGMPYKFV
jgi:hypothetical protein